MLNVYLIKSHKIYVQCFPHNGDSVPLPRLIDVCPSIFCPSINVHILLFMLSKKKQTLFSV